MSCNNPWFCKAYMEGTPLFDLVMHEMVDKRSVVLWEGRMGMQCVQPR